MSQLRWSHASEKSLGEVEAARTLIIMSYIAVHVPYMRHGKVLSVSITPETLRSRMIEVFI